MNERLVLPGAELEKPLDILLANLAIRIQLSETAHKKAVERYESIQRWIERDGSPLAGLVELFYPQGSMAISAAIASRVTGDEYDLDVVVQVKVPTGWTPKDVLDALYVAIRGGPGSRYCHMVERRTRCVTVSYTDMHLDLTPHERRAYAPEREGDIFHHKEGTPGPMHRCVANPYGFAEWFNMRTADQSGFAEAYAARARAYELAIAKADADPVPDQEPLSLKSRAVIALQLTKRWRNVQYERRSGRKPPSVMMSKFAGDAAGQTAGLADELWHQAALMRDCFRAAAAAGTRIHVVNPVCDADVLTDRWPISALDERVFLADLERFVQELEWLMGDRDLAEIRQAFVKLFGERPTKTVFEDFNRRTGEAVQTGQSRHRRRNGSIVVPGAMGGALAPKRRFYGGRAWWR